MSNLQPIYLLPQLDLTQIWKLLGVWKYGKDVIVSGKGWITGSQEINSGLARKFDKQNMSDHLSEIEVGAQSDVYGEWLPL